MAVKIKLKRMGKIRAPYYRIIVADARTKRDGRAIEEIGKYHPKAEPSFIEVDSDRAQHWLAVGAQPTDPVRKLLEITGDWQRFKGLPGAEGSLRTAAPKADKKEAFAAAAAESLADSGTTTKARGKTADARAEGKTGGAKASSKTPAKGKKAPAKADAAQTEADTAAADAGKADAEQTAAAEAEQAAAADAEQTAAAAADARAEAAAAEAEGSEA